MGKKQAHFVSFLENDKKKTTNKPTQHTVQYSQTAVNWHTKKPFIYIRITHTFSSI